MDGQRIKGTIEAMEKGLFELNCGDCAKCDNLGLGLYFCDETGLPIKDNQTACISIMPKLSARERRECLTK